MYWDEDEKRLKVVLFFLNVVEMFLNEVNLLIGYRKVIYVV